MRILVEPADAASFEALVACATAVDQAGLDGVFVPETRELPAPLVTAAALAATSDSILLAAQVAVGDRHPLEVAEEAAVVDQVSRGRLIMVAYSAGPDDLGYLEAVDVIRMAGAARPFRFSGSRWPIPNERRALPDRPVRRVRVTPSPFGARLEIWAEGGEPRDWLARGVGVVSDGQAGSRVPSGAGAPLARRLEWRDAETLIERLAAGRSAFHQDWAIVKAPVEAVSEIGRVVRPRLALDSLPADLLEHWGAAVQRPDASPRPRARRRRPGR